MSRDAIIIAESGEMTSYSPKNGRDFELEEMQDIVGGNIELIELNDGSREYLMIVNEEGKLIDGYGLNARATVVAKAFRALSANDWICGPAILCPASMVK